LADVSPRPGRKITMLLMVERGAEVGWLMGRREEGREVSMID
jgi:hypothetical protein